MINLLPTDVKESIAYARRNTKLRRWAFAMVLSILCISGMIFAGQLYLQQSINTYAAAVKQGTEDLQAQKVDETNKQVQDVTNNLKLVIQVLSREVLFSKLLQQFGTVMPDGAVLTNLSISKLQGGLDLEASARDYQIATQVLLNMQDPNNKIFDKADLINIQCTTTKNPTDSIKTLYPCTVQIHALFAKNNPFLFIQPTTSSSSSSNSGAKP